MSADRSLMWRWARRLALGLGLAVLAASIWLIGPLLGVAGQRPLESQGARLATFVVVLGLLGLGRWRARRRAARRTLEFAGARRLGRFDIGDIALLLTALALALALFLIGRAYLASRAHVAHMTEVADALTEQAAQMPSGPPPLREVLLLLDKARAAALEPAPELPPLLGLGMNYGDMLTAGAELAYGHLLKDPLQPLVLQALEHGLENLDLRPAMSFEILKAYVSWFEPARLDRDHLVALLGLMLGQDPALVGDPGAQASLAVHLAALFAQPAQPPATPNLRLVEAARSRLAAFPRAALLWPMAASRARFAASAGDWQLIDATGPQGSRVFQRASGQPLAALQVSGDFSPQTLQAMGRPQNDPLRLVDEFDWVLGPGASRLAPARESAEQVAAAAWRLYQTAYITHWRAALDELRLVGRTAGAAAPVADPAAALALAPLHVFCDPVASPLRRLAQSVAQATAPGAPPAPKPLGLGARLDKLAALSQLAAGSQASAPAREAAAAIEAAFAPLHRWVAIGADGRAPLDATLAALREVDQRLMADAQGQPPRLSAESAAAVTRALAEALRLPGPFDRLVQAAVVDARALVAGGASNAR